MSEVATRFAPGVVTGEGVTEIFRHANENDYALPAVNVVGTDLLMPYWKRLKPLTHR